MRSVKRTTKKLLREEPVAITALVQAVIGLGIAFSWWRWTPAQTGAVVGLVAGALTLIRGLVIPTAKRHRVSSPAASREPAGGPAGAVAPAG
jgi:hypothetical protein